MKTNKVLIHGATNTCNFGDVLFASLIYKRLNAVGGLDVYFLEFPRYGVGEFVRKELSYSKKISLIKALKCDKLVYMPGGYFGDDRKSLKKAIKRYFRYVTIGSWFRRHKKEIIISGLGGGPLYYSFVREAVVRIINSASFVSFRDIESFNYFADNGVTNNCIVTADAALTITKKDIPQLDIVVKDEISKNIGNRKIIFLHVSFDEKIDRKIADIIVPAINRYVEENDFGIVLGFDGVADPTNTIVYEKIRKTNLYVYQYHSAWQLCALLNSVDVVITHKLHVGIVSSALSKSVLSFPVHQHKTVRFYEQINERDRCIKLNDTKTENVYNSLQRYANVKIVISEETRKLAESNFSFIKGLTEVS